MRLVKGRREPVFCSGVLIGEFVGQRHKEMSGRSSWERSAWERCVIVDRIRLAVNRVLPHSVSNNPALSLGTNWQRASLDREPRVQTNHAQRVFIFFCGIVLRVEYCEGIVWHASPEYSSFCLAGWPPVLRSTFPLSYSSHLQAGWYIPRMSLLSILCYFKRTDPVLAFWSYL